MNLSVKWIPWLVGLVALAATIAVFVFLRSSEEHAAENQFRRDATERLLAVHNEFDSAMQPVSFLASYFATSSEISRAQFQTFTAQSVRGEPTIAGHSTSGAIQALEWIPRVTLEDRLAHEQSAVDDGFGGYEITERSADGDLIRATERADYFPVYFVEPLEGNEAAVGFDLASDPSRLAALEHARDSGELTITERITLVQETGEQAGFLTFLAVYRGDNAPATVEERRAQLEGFVLGVYRVGNVVTAALADLTTVDVNMVLLDESASPEKQQLFPASSESTATAELGLATSVLDSESGLAETLALTVGGRQWRLAVTPGAGYISAQQTLLPFGVLVGGLVFTAVITAYLVVLSGRRAQIERTVVKKTAELTQVNIQLQHQARTDPLTGTLNHGAIVGELRQLVSERQGTSHVVSLVDVDGLKSINDTFGHLTGDQVLRSVASGLRVGDATVGRYGGDEFVVILREAGSSDASRYQEQVEANLKAIEIIDPSSGSPVAVSATIGSSVFPDEAQTVADLLRLADGAMYETKRQRPSPAARNAGEIQAARLVLDLVPIVAAPGSFHEKLQTVGSRISAALGYDAIHIGLFSDSPGSFIGRNVDGVETLRAAWLEDRPRAERQPLREILSETKRPIIIPEVKQDERLPVRMRDVLTEAAIGSGLVAPLLWNGQVVGSIAAGRTREDSFSTQDAHSLFTVAGQVAVILKTAAFVDEVRQSSAEGPLSTSGETAA